MERIGKWSSKYHSSVTFLGIFSGLLYVVLPKNLDPWSTACPPLLHLQWLASDPRRRIAASIVPSNSGHAIIKLCQQQRQQSWPTGCPKDSVTIQGILFTWNEASVCFRLRFYLKVLGEFQISCRKTILIPFSIMLPIIMPCCYPNQLLHHQALSLWSLLVRKSGCNTWPKQTVPWKIKKGSWERLTSDPCIAEVESSWHIYLRNHYVWKIRHGRWGS